MSPTTYVPRLLDGLLDELLRELPAVLVVGPRATGKTTTCRRHAASIIRLDRRAEALAVAADPDSVLADLEGPVLIDEWQAVPDVLSAVKRLVDDDPRPGRFLLTGSARSDALAAGWPATGRVVRATQWGLCQRELLGKVGARSFFDCLFDGDIRTVVIPAPAPDLAGYVDLALGGGFPEAVFASSDSGRRHWLEGYVDQLVSRDASETGTERDPRRLRRYLQAIASNTAGVVDHKTLYDAAGITRASGLAYDGLLDLLMVTQQLPAWSGNRLLRLTRMPKRFVADPALLSALLGVNRLAVLRDGDLLGRLIETFVFAQLRPEQEASEVRPSLWHLRDANGRHEVDLIAEAPDGRVVGIEIKATSAPDRASARHLLWLREQLGDRFVAGVVFHTGPRAFDLIEGIHALPIASLWGSVRRA
jgi:uncharacterized protein